jgi:hypothetical protein
MGMTEDIRGHTTSHMVRRVYAKIGEQSKRDALAKLPRLIDPTVTLSVTAHGRKRGRSGLKVQSKRKSAKVVNAKTPQKAGFAVPRDGIEPPTRGFSIPARNGENTRNQKWLRLLKG